MDHVGTIPMFFFKWISGFRCILELVAVQLVLFTFASLFSINCF